MSSFKSILIIILISTALFSAKVTTKEWEKGKTFSEYLENKKISLDVLETISKSDIKYLSEIEGGELFYELNDEKGSLLQVLIPIGEEMQLRLAKEYDSPIYTFDIIPIAYKEKEYKATIHIKNNLNMDICNTLHHPALAHRMGKLFKGTVNTRKFHKGDKISFIYTQRTRMGSPYYMPKVKIAMFESKHKKQLIYADEDGYGYKSDEKLQAYTVTGKKKVTYMRRVTVSKKNARFGMPLRHARITSSFSYRRYHPILKRYRPHHGTDFGAKRGTPLFAVNAGRVSFAGRMGGYGKVVKIKHSGGYESLYAHQSRIRVKKGQHVKKGQIIGYVGSTGRSTGPHLHFGLRKHGRWIDPMKVLRKKSIQRSILKKFTKYKTTKRTEYKKVDIKNAKENREKLLKYIKQDGESFVWNVFSENSMKVEDGKSCRKL